MPIRVKPVQDLGPCLLDIESIKGICTLVDRTFHYAHYSATDGAWEIYGEESRPFLDAIEGRMKLDSFVVNAPSAKAWGPHYDIATIVGNEIPELNNQRKLSLVFDKSQANAKFDVSPEQIEWIEHFMLDLKKHIKQDRKINMHRFIEFTWPLFVASMTSALGEYPSTRVYEINYSRIILKPRETNPIVKSVRDNLISNAIYDITKVAVGIIIAFVSIWMFNRYGIDITKWIDPPSIPTPTP